MTYVVYRPNPLDRTQDSTTFVGHVPTVRKALEARFPKFVEFEQPTIVLVGKVPRLRSMWDAPLRPSDVVEVVAVPGALAPALLTALTIGSLLVSAYVIYKVSTLPSISDAVGGAVPEKPSSFTFEGQKNVTRLNNVVEVGYGRCRWWPAYLCAPRVEYTNNKPILKMWLSLGKGDYQLDEVLVNDTPFGTVAKAEYVQYDSGSTLTASDEADLVYYAEDFSGTEIPATNDDEYGIIGPYNLNPANTVIEEIIVNFSYGGGLYAIDANGALQNATVNVTIFVHELTDAGIATGITVEHTIVHTYSTSSPVRITERIPLSDLFTHNRFSLSVARTNAKNTATGGQDNCTIEAAYATGHSAKTYQASLLYVELPGTTIVGQDAAEKVNVVATRKLRIRKDGAWTSPIATRNPIHACVDILQAEYGAARPDSSLDLSYWEELAEECSAVNFDYRFEQKTTVWDALTAVATVLRGKPYWVGSDVRVFVDSPVQTPVAVFTPDNTADMKLHMAFIASTENDCIEAAYIDADTGLQDSVFFTPPGSSAANPTKVTFAGVTDRETAWKLAAYTYLQRTLLRDKISFSTGMEGKIPLLGEVILASQPLPSWDSAGIVLSFDGVNRLELSEPVAHAAGWIAFRKNNGGAWGPVKFEYLGELSDDGNPVITLAAAFDPSFDVTATTRDPVAYTLGTETVTTRKFQVTNAIPAQDSVQVEAVEFNPSVFGYDNLSVPERGDDMLPYPGFVGPVPWLRVLEESGQYLRVEAGPVYGSPSAVICYYSYVQESVATTALLADPWSAVLTMQEADPYGASFYIPRQAGATGGEVLDPYILFVKLVVEIGPSTYTTWWRSQPGEYPEGEHKRVTHACLVNNVDIAYVGPGDDGNVAGLAAQGTSKGPYVTAKLDVNDAKIVVATDCPPGASAVVYLESFDLVDDVPVLSASVSKRIKDVGPVTFTAEEIAQAGIQGTEDAYQDVLSVRINHVIDGAESAESVGFELDVQPLITDPIAQTCQQLSLSKAKFVTTQWYYVDGEGHAVFVTFASNLVQIYLSSMLESFSGAVGYITEQRAQTTANMAIAPIIRTVASKANGVPVYKFRYPHIDQIVVTGYSGVFDSLLVIQGHLHIGNLSFSEASEEAQWSAVLLDANYDVIVYGEIDPAFANRVTAVGPTDLVIPFSSAVPDSLQKYRISLWNGLTAEDVAYFEANLKYIVFVNTAAFKLPSVNTAGWGAVKMTMVDMFGRHGNTTAASIPSMP